MISINDGFIAEWHPRYDETERDEPEYQRLIAVTSTDLAATGTVSQNTFLAIWGWKGALRVIGHVKLDEYEQVYASRFRLAASALPDRRLDILLNPRKKLPGVGAPTGSTLLHFMDPIEMPIIDVRTVEVLFDAGLLWSKGRELPHYVAFRKAILEIRNRCPRWTLRQIDRALFAYHKQELEPQCRAASAS